MRPRDKTLEYQVDALAEYHDSDTSVSAIWPVGRMIIWKLKRQERFAQDV